MVMGYTAHAGIVGGSMSWVTWVFGGFGVAIPIALAGWFFFDRRSSSRQHQAGGDHSTNIQVGNDLTIGDDFRSGNT
ncbi:hypothetical protein [Streptodolium elevatio]|uniref:Uncharacterized protein n=1 Tax=Streptodolium elevatio TaxID=3157996 RepID=A0ABV3DR13_9ACTN